MISAEFTLLNWLVAKSDCAHGYPAVKSPLTTVKCSPPPPCYPLCKSMHIHAMPFINYNTVLDDFEYYIAAPVNVAAVYAKVSKRFLAWWQDLFQEVTTRQQEILPSG